MAITKTKFINYVRCPRYVALENVKKDKLNSFVSFNEYKEEEKLYELLDTMYDGDEDLIDIKNEHLEVMLPYYNDVEILAGILAPKYFNGTFKFARNTVDQESFDFKRNGIRYICYVDIYNETEEAINIIEVKATTTKKFIDLGYTVNGEKHSIFKKENNIYKLTNENTMQYKKSLEKLFDKYSSAGHYVYDLAVQRYIIENDLKGNGMNYLINKNKYYLAVLNHEYIFDGTYENDKPVYNMDKNGNEIISYIDLTDITKVYYDIINNDRKKIEKYLNEFNADRCNLGNYCQMKQTTKCKFCKVCYNILPEKNNVMQFIGNHNGFKDGETKYSVYDLINSGKVSMLDIDNKMLSRNINKIQKESAKTHEIYINKDKIFKGIKTLKYPIYHLDFETFPCPLPRYKGEKCYSQSVFQFSLHIEKEKGICDKEKDHYGYLSKNHKDNREELIKEMIKLIKKDGTVLVYNEAFEKTRLKELADIFPNYKKELLQIRDMIFDLLYIIKTNTKFYEKLGYSKEESKEVNYYNENMLGSFSIKKILPLFSNLTYKGMEIGNGVEALVTYAKFNIMDKEEYDYKYKKLIEYCKQDTWAMVEILKGLRNVK